MTTGNMLYLLMVIGTFVSFSAVLAFVSWKQSVVERETVPASDETEQPHEAIAA